MILPITEHADGLADGGNRAFSTSRPYRPGTLVVFLNEIALHREGEDGWDETGPCIFRMKEAPRVGDSLSVYYLPQY